MTDKHYIMAKQNGTKFCHGCKKHYSGNLGNYCVIPKFEGQYTEECPKREMIK